MLTTLDLDRYSDLDMLCVADAAVAVLEDEAEQLRDLVRAVSFDILDGTVNSNTMRRILTGSALMRTLNITAQMRLYGEDPDFSA